MPKKISVLLVTYNHELFIGECINSILKQSIADDIEIIWNDDSSTDRTREIGDAILSGSNVQVKRLFRANNRHQKRVPIVLDLLEQAEGEYIACLDGDDYWTDDNKLSIQKKALDQYTEIDLCFGRAPVVDLDSIRIDRAPMGSYGDAPLNISASDVIRGDGGFMHTGSIFMRADVLRNAPNWVFEAQPVGDYIFQVLGCLRNGVVYLPMDLSCWRTSNEHSFTGKYEANIKFTLDFEAEFIGLLKKMQATFDQKFKADFDHMIFNHFVMMLKKAIPHSQYEQLLKAAMHLNFNIAE